MTDLDDDTPEAWRAWVPDLVDKIKDGTFDPDLSELWMAIINRLSTENDLKAITTSAISRAKALGYLGNGKAVGAAPAFVVKGYASDITGIVGEDGARIPSTSATVGTITCLGNNYRKARIINQVFRLKRPTATDPRWFLDGVVVKVVGTGHKNIRVRFPTDPRPAHDQSYQLAEMWEKSQRDVNYYVTLPVEWIIPALQDALSLR